MNEDKLLLEKALTLLSAANCPTCDNSGTIQVSEDEVYQCQFCTEREQLLRKEILICE